METFLNWVNGILGLIFAFLPSSPFQSTIASIEKWDWLHWLNWLVPVGTLITIGELWITAIIAHYAYSVILRFINAIE